MGEVLPGAQVDRLANADLRAGPRYVDRLLSTTSVRDLLKGGAAPGRRQPASSDGHAIRAGCDADPARLRGYFTTLARLGPDLGNTLVRDIVARGTLALIMEALMRGIAAPWLFAYQRIDRVLLGTVLNGASVEVKPPTGELHEAFGPCGVVVRSTVRYAAPDKEATFLAHTEKWKIRALGLNWPERR